MNATGQDDDPSSGSVEPVVTTPADPRQRHVRVNLSNVAKAAVEYPGVILTWRRTGAGWEAQVAYATTTNESALHVVWAPADRVRPA